MTIYGRIHQYKIVQSLKILL